MGRLAAQWAAGEFREPRALIPSDDPRFVKMRDLLDRGWAAYHAHYPVADLAEQTPALVLVEDPVVNAFVIPDLETDTSGFAVMVHTGVFDIGAPDDEMLGLVFHELGEDYDDLVDIVFRSEVYREAAVRAVFLRYLGRDPSGGELHAFVGALDPANPDVRPGIQAVVSSGEYYAQ